MSTGSVQILFLGNGLLTGIAVLFNIITNDDFTLSRAGVSCYRKCPECVQQNQRDAAGFNYKGVIHWGAGKS
jgi:hypothetical protein